MDKLLVAAKIQRITKRIEQQRHERTLDSLIALGLADTREQAQRFLEALTRRTDPRSQPLPDYLL